MQAAILSGGLATRMRPLTRRLPKALLDIHGRPFLEHQLELLKRNGVTDIVLCVGHLARQIEDRFGAGQALGVRIRYSDEGPRRMGTAGALRKAAPLLEDRFFVLDGDAYLPLDYREVMARFERRKTRALMVVYRNRDRYDRSNVVIDSDRVKLYHRDSQAAGMIHIHAGLSVLNKDVLALMDPDRPCSLDALWPRLIKAGELRAFETSQRFYEIGSLKGLAEFRRFMKGGPQRR